jgi:hypothetical protein
MKIEIYVTKQHLASLIFAIVIVAGINYSVAQLGDPDPGHSPGEIGPGVFSGLSTDIWSFPGKLGIGTASPLGRLDVGGHFVVKDDGKVGIGTPDPSSELEVIGKIKSISTSDSDSNETLVTKDYVDNLTSRITGCAFCASCGRHWPIKRGGRYFVNAYSWWEGYGNKCKVPYKSYTYATPYYLCCAN